MVLWYYALYLFELICKFNKSANQIIFGIFYDSFLFIVVDDVIEVDGTLGALEKHKTQLHPE